MKKPIILLDVDGVLVNHNARHLDALNETYGTSYAYSDITDFHYSFMPQHHRDALYNLWHAADLYDHDVIHEVQMEVIGGLREIGRVMACSSPLEGHISSKYRFLLRYFDRRDIVLTADKSLVGGTILIDDGPHNIKAFPGHGIIFDQPWNQGVKAPRARTFEDIGPLVQDYLITQALLKDEDIDAYI